MVFRKIELKEDMIIDHVKIDFVTQIKFLGVILDEHLTFESHVEYTKEILQGALVFCNIQESISKKVQWKHYIMLLYIHISPIVLQSGATLATQSSSLWLCYKNVQWSEYTYNRNLTIPTHYSNYLKFCLSETYMYTLPSSRPLQILQTIPSEYFSGFFTINETIHNHYTRPIEHFHTRLAKSSQRARTLRCTGVKIDNYFMKLNENILMNDISHLYGCTRWLSTLNKKLHIVHLVF